MYHNHAKALARRQGKAHISSHISMYTDGSPPNSASTSERGEHAPVGSEASILAESESSKATDKSEKGKITAVVDVPQSKYEYHPLKPPIIETPRLRDMGEATPPLEWIGLNRDRLPNLTHQVCSQLSPAFLDAYVMTDRHSLAFGGCEGGGRCV
jgi:hypothetical protein